MPSPRHSVVVLIAVLTLLLLPPSSFGQTPTPVPRDVLIEIIRKQAKRDAENDKQADARDLNALFGTDAAAVNLPLREVVQIYEDEHSAARNPSLWKKVRPQGGWIVAVILFILFIFRNVVQRIVEHALQRIHESIYVKLAGHRILRRTALRRYRRALIRKYEKLKVAFRPDRPLDVREIYVPLKVKGTNDVDQVDAFKSITEHKCLMVLGLPGSGKSMLLRHVALSYADGRLMHLQDQPIPILLELSRLNDSDKTIQDSLVEILRLSDFPRAENFVNAGLEQGRLMLLLDGLDEVNSEKRPRVVQAITDLLDEFEGCRAIITCRTAVYRNEFSQSVEQTLEIVDFNDQQVQIFLKSWQPSMPPDKSVEQLIRTLRERPRIMSLARNPLLLTIIAYLYTDTNFVLPHSRAEFYDQSVDVLLQHWKKERNNFKGPQKRLVLQHLALFNQDGGVKRSQDRRSIDLVTIIEEIKKVLPGLNLSVRDANKILDEIVERSSLMLSIDGGTRYQFAHLTLQEFFAADALRDDANGLLARYVEDKDAWRETVKLWCGIGHNSTELIRAIYKEDPITAFECLADTQLIDPDLAEEIIDGFKTRINTSERSMPVIKAFAAVASDIVRPRGQAVFNFLAESLETSEGSEKITAVATTLAYTNMPAAAEVLIRHYKSKPEVRPALVWMGDIAVPMLSAFAQEGMLTVLDDLQAIGTPNAASALVPFLWHKVESIAVGSAIRLASLLHRPNVGDALRNYPLTKEQRTGYFKDILDPFNEPATSPLSIIIGRITYLLSHYMQSPTYQNIVPPQISIVDMRVVVPLLLHIQSFRMVTPHSLKELYNSPSKDIVTLLEKVGQYIPLNADKVARNFNSLYQVIRTARNTLESDKSSDGAGQTRLGEHEEGDLTACTAALIRELLKVTHSRSLDRSLSLLDVRTQMDLFHRLVREPVPTMQDWNNIFRPVKFRFKTSWQFRLAIFLVGVMSIYGLAGIWYLPPKPSFVTYRVPVLLVSLAGMVITWAGIMKLIYEEQYKWDSWFPYAIVIFGLPGILHAGIAGVANAVGDVLDPERKARTWLMLVISCFGLPFIYFAYLLRSTDQEPSVYVTVPLVPLLIGAIIIAVPLLLLIAKADLDPYIPSFATLSDEFDRELLRAIIKAVAFLVYLTSTAYFASLFLLQSFSAATAAAIWVVFTAVLILLCRKGLKKDRAARNPLHGLLDKSLGLENMQPQP